jgi:hypothetical protein
MENVSQDRGAAIVCKHVASQEFPILRAVRDEPTIEEDSGWQFLCNSGAKEDHSTARTCGIFEVLDLEPSLKMYINEPVGTVLVRANKDKPWVMTRK